MVSHTRWRSQSPTGTEKIPLLSWQGFSQQKNRRHIVYDSPPNFLLPSIKVFSFCCLRDLHVAHHGCRPQTAMFCLFQINLYFSNKYLAVYLFYGNILVAHMGTRKDPQRFWTGEQTGAVPTIEPIMLTPFLANPGVRRYIFLLDLSSCTPYISSSPDFIWELF